MGCNTVVMLGFGRQPQLPVSQEIAGVNNPYTYNHSVPSQPFCFSLSVQCPIHDIIYSTFYYKIGFVLHDFAQL